MDALRVLSPLALTLSCFLTTAPRALLSLDRNAVVTGKRPLARLDEKPLTPEKEFLGFCNALLQPYLAGIRASCRGEHWDGAVRGTVGVIADLRECNKRTEWARQHIDALRPLIRQLIEGGADTFSNDLDRSSGWWTLRLKQKPVPVEFSFMIGDILHNLRSTLDHLVWQLTIANGKTPDSFPLAKESKMSCQSPSSRRGRVVVRADQYAPGQPRPRLHDVCGGCCHIMAGGVAEGRKSPRKCHAALESFIEHGAGQVASRALPSERQIAKCSIVHGCREHGTTGRLERVKRTL